MAKFNCVCTSLPACLTRSKPWQRLDNVWTTYGCEGISLGEWRYHLGDTTCCEFFCFRCYFYWSSKTLILTLFRGKTHVFRGKTNLFRGIATLPRLNTCLLCPAQVARLKTKPFYMKLVNCFIGSAVFLSRNTAVLCWNMRLLRRNKRLLRENLKHPPVVKR